MNRKFSRLAFALSVLFLASSCSQTIIPDSESQKPQKDSSPVTVSLPMELDARGDNAYNTLSWSETDTPVLCMLTENKDTQVSIPVSSSINAGTSASYTFEFGLESEESRYWLCKSGSYTSDQLPDPNKFPITIPSVQTPTVDAPDPAGDILMSEVSFALPQDYLAEQPLELDIKRHNAIASLNVHGLPKNHTLVSLDIKVPNYIVGTMFYNVPEKVFLKNSEQSGELSVKFENGLGSVVEADGSRKILLSLWPGSIPSYVIKATTNDLDGNSHNWTSNFTAFSKSIYLESQHIAPWDITMKEDGVQPVLPETPVVKETVIEGGDASTKALFDKIKAYADNGVSSYSGCRTHIPGYAGVKIHEGTIMQYKAPVHLLIIEADPNVVSFALGTPYNYNTAPAQQLQTVTQQAKFSGKKVIAAINGDAWGVGAGGKGTYGVMFKDGICLSNNAIAPNHLANTDTFYTTDEGKIGIVDEIDFQTVLKNYNVTNAIGGWYRLISQGGEPYAQSGAKDGDPLLRDRNSQGEGLKNFLGLQPRTFMGITDDRAYILVADGRISTSVGLTMNGCARIVYSLGCKRGVNFDGGGSTTMIKKNGTSFKVLNHPSDGSERSVANTLLVVAR